MIDWDLACRIGSLASGSPSADGLKPAMLEQVCDQSLAAVIKYTGLSPAGRIPTAESVSRTEWISANAESMGRMLDPLLESADSTKLGGLQLLGSAAVTVEAGAVLGLLSRKVLGQYDVSLVAAAGDPPPRLLFVGPNVGQISAGLGESGVDFVRWVAVHEVTHAVQFGAVDWLRAHIGGLASELISKILGMDMKMRQYQLGREFCDHVVGDAGMSALNQVWTEPAALPDTSELSDPEMWLRRVAA